MTRASRVIEEAKLVTAVAGNTKVKHMTMTVLAQTRTPWMVCNGTLPSEEQSLVVGGVRVMVGDLTGM